jgi:phosphopantetheinyl transferase
VFAEVRNAVGACDIVVFTPQYIYIIEIKIDTDPQVALNQIASKAYAKPYLTDGRKIIKVGVSFSTNTRTIEAWKCE